MISIGAFVILVCGVLAAVAWACAQEKNEI
jgi:hypothetical protein